MPLGRKVGLDPSETVLNGDPAPPPQKGGRAPLPIFDLCLLWPNGALIKMPRHIMLDGDPAPPPPKKGHSPQISAHVCCGQTAAWIKMPLCIIIIIIKRKDLGGVMSK